MKFLTRINRNYLILFALILAGVTIAGYLILHIIIIRDAKENLLTKEYLIEKQILNTGEIPNLHPIIEVQKTDDKKIIESSFRKVVIRNELENENETFLEYSNKIKINDSYYLIKLRQSAFENEDLVLMLALTLFTLLASAFVISFFVTKKMNKTVWADFEQNLHEIESFSLSKNNDITLLESDTEEFGRLNKVINNLTEKLKSDYLVQKEFTENASHEIQTPLSIALINLEEILQQDLKEETFQKAATVKSVSLKEILARKLDEFSLLLETKTLDVKVQIEQDFQIEMNEQLAEFLISNLLSNAINHNIKGGRISILMHSASLRICNTGEDNSLTNETIFNRFVSGNPKSCGLGLAIVRKICETNDLEINYCKDEQHCFIFKIKS
jgi:signal transduction histidine kinase